MASTELKEAGISLASSKKIGNQRGTVFLDRTIYYTVEEKDTSGKTMVDGSGTPIIKNKAYLTAGRWITPLLMQKAELIEEEFIELNTLFRKHMPRWKIEKPTQLIIDGVTNK